jgi:manganese/zinc/iron transport system permease protein
MAGVSLATVVSFESVGAVLVIAFLSGPAATAFLLTKDFKKMIFLAIAFGISASILGYYMADWLKGSIAGAITTVIGIQFAMAFVYIQFLRKARISDTLEHIPMTDV